MSLLIQNEIVNMESKAKSDAAEADLLNELEKEKLQSKEKPQSKKRRDRSKKVFEVLISLFASLKNILHKIYRINLSDIGFKFSEQVNNVFLSYRDIISSM